jgi:hypothetical protein
MGIGPSSKETTLHHFRDPLTELLCQDKSLDFRGILFQGTPENYGHKQFVAERSGVYAEMMRADGAIVEIDSWGNSHVDFTSVIQALGERNIPLVGLSFVGNQAAFVVTNQYMDCIVDFNKTSLGIETCMVGQNTVDELDARKTVAFLKHKILKKFPDRANAPVTEKILRKLRLNTYPVQDVQLVERTEIQGKCLFLDKGGLGEIAGHYPEIEAIKLSLILPDTDDFFINSILDFSPLAAKVSGRPGEGVSNVLDGVKVMLTAVETGGFQPANIGSSEGMFRERVYLGRRGTPDGGEIIIHCDVLLAEGEGRTRTGIIAAHRACDELIQRVRLVMKGMDAALAGHRQDFYDIARPGGLRVLVIKLVSGLGCMYDTAFFPNEPAGCLGSRSVMELSNNIQIPLTPNEYRDGMLHSLC